MIRRSLLLSQDNQSSLIERSYQNALLGGNLQQTLKVGLQNLSKLTKMLFCRAANNVKLKRFTLWKE